MRGNAGRSSLKNFIYAAISSSIFLPCRCKSVNSSDFILEVGRDFTFIDEEFRVQVGGEGYKIDLLFFHWGLQCLVVFELKIGKFKPEYISKMDFYLEALDRQKKKEKTN